MESNPQIARSPTVRRDRWLAWLQLVRLPNVFTTAADITMAFLCVHRGLQPWPQYLLLLTASASIYTGGIVLNDYYDFATDLRERAWRPLPAGRIRRSSAAWLGGGLLALGGAAALLAAPLCGLVALVLSGLVWFYDGVVKQSPRWRNVLGPPVMASCRFTNVVLGLSAAGAIPRGTELIPAFLVGSYILGVTWLSLNEAAESRRGSLLSAAALLQAVFALLLLWIRPKPYHSLGLLLAAVLIGGLDARIVGALREPAARRVQAAVKTGVLGLILLDAAIVAALHGPLPALGIVALLAPALGLGRWLYST